MQSHSKLLDNCCVLLGEENHNENKMEMFMENGVFYIGSSISVDTVYTKC